MKVYLVTRGEISPITESVHATFESAQKRRAEIVQEDMEEHKHKLTATWTKIRTTEQLYKEESRFSNVEAFEVQE